MDPRQPQQGSSAPHPAPPYAPIPPFVVPSHASSSRSQLPPAGPSYLPPHAFYNPAQAPSMPYHHHHHQQQQQQQQAMAPASFTWQLPPHLTAQMAAASSLYHHKQAQGLPTGGASTVPTPMPMDHPSSSSSSKRRRLDEEEDELEGPGDEDDGEDMDVGDKAWTPEVDGRPKRSRRRSHAADGETSALGEDGEAGPLERTFRDPEGDSPSDIELMPDVVLEGLRPPEDTVENMFEIPLLMCEWDDCANGYWTVDDLVDHLTNDHVPPVKGAGSYPCNWRGCTRFGKGQTTRHALLAHLRSHTAERPHACPKPECDRTFTRTDALFKHMQAAHDETLAPTRKPPTKRKRKQPDDSDEQDARGADASKPETALPPPIHADEDTPTLRRILASTPDPAYARYIVIAAKVNWLEEERTRLKAELEAAQAVEQQLRSERDAALDETLRRELGAADAAKLARIDPASVTSLVWTYADRSSLRSIEPRADGLQLLRPSAQPGPSEASRGLRGLGDEDA